MYNRKHPKGYVKQRNDKIREELKTLTVSEIAKKYDLAETTVYQISKKLYPEAEKTETQKLKEERNKTMKAEFFQRRLAKEKVDDIYYELGERFGLSDARVKAIILNQ